jgi:hypothetical protein
LCPKGWGTHGDDCGNNHGEQHSAFGFHIISFITVAAGQDLVQRRAVRLTGADITEALR